MIFNIKEIEFAKAFNAGQDKFQHTRGTYAKLFPFATDADKKEETEAHLKDFNAITAALHRNWLNIETSLPNNETEIIEQLVNSVDTTNKIELYNIIKTILFVKDQSIKIFDKTVIPYIKNGTKNAKISNLIEFLFHFFDDEEIAVTLKERFKEAPKSNTLHNLFLTYLEKQKNSIDPLVKDPCYFNGEITRKYRKMFVDDFLNLIKNETLYKDNVNYLIKYYYFAYINALTLELNQFININSNIKLFFSLEWEKLSQTRLAIDNGYKKLEHSILNLFTHANCIELLNTIDFSETYPNQIVLYNDVRLLYAQYEDHQLIELDSALNKLFKRYINSIKDIDWDDENAQKHISTGKEIIEPQGLKILRKLYNAIKYQFENSGRRSANEFYYKTYRSFVDLNYKKIRGRLGATLKLDKETLLMFTELSILHLKVEKITITTLWDELERRGINLDLQSKQEVIDYFQKINILEKKSDSGNVQYVTKMFK